MEINKPDGCNAAAISSWKFEQGTYTLTTKLVCGERTNDIPGSFTREFMDIGSEEKRRRVEVEVTRQTTEVLGAMCLGCPYNSMAAPSER